MLLCGVSPDAVSMCACTVYSHVKYGGEWVGTNRGVPSSDLPEAGQPAPCAFLLRCSADAQGHLVTGLAGCVHVVGCWAVSSAHDGAFWKVGNSAP